MLLKTIFLPLWLASLGASVAIPIQSEFWCCPVEGGPYTPNLKECICPPSKDKREQDSDLYAYRGDAAKHKREQDSDLYGYPGSKPPMSGCPGRGPGCYCPGGPGCPSEDKRELDGDLYNYVDGDSVDYKAKREQDSDLHADGGDASEPKSELDGDLYNYTDGDSVNYKAKREEDSGLYSKPPIGTCKGGGPGCFCPNGEPGCTPTPPEEAKRELDGDLYNYVDGDSVNYKAKREEDSGLYSKPPIGTCKGGGPGCFCPNGEPGCTPTPPEEEAKRELDGDLYNYVDGDSVNYKTKREQDGGLYSKPPKGNPGYPYCPGPVGCPPPEGGS